jgi:hypothetical protein
MQLEPFIPKLLSEYYDGDGDFFISVQIVEGETNHYQGRK